MVAFIDTQEKIGIRVRDLHALKWQFILSYLIVEGRRFNEVNYSKYFIKFLINQIRIDDRQSFYSNLVASITSTSIPTTHSYSARVAMIFSNLLQESSGLPPEMDSSDSDNKSLEKYAESVTPNENFKTTISDSLDDCSEEKAGFDEGIFTKGVSVEEKADLDENIFTRDEFFEDETDLDEDVYIGNAGLVLLSPYLPRYFESLGLVEGRAFKDRNAAERGVHLLQFMLDGSSSNPEFLLVLNKILCGIKTGVPILPSIDISEQEIELSESLLAGVIGNWPALKNSTISGLRESFLQRDAHLQLKNDVWQLLVEAKPFDMLLDEIPWNYKTIKLPWMTNLISVDWR